ncbi:MAG: sigma-70 family RNA polymerase sigma factor [Pseudomonadota bacterium]
MKFDKRENKYVDSCVQKNDSVTPSSRISEFFRLGGKRLVDSLKATYGKGPPDPEDVVQQAFINILKHPNPDQIKDLEAFMWTCSRNIIITESRKQSVRSKYAKSQTIEKNAPSVDIFDPERVTINKEQLKRVDATISTMSPVQRRILILHRLHGLSLSEIARQLEIGRTAVVYHLSKAMSCLENAMNAQPSRDDGCDQ